VARVAEPGADVDEDDFPFPVFSVPLEDPGGQPFDDRVELARTTLRCKELRAFVDRWSAPLTPRRFVGNLVGAPGATALRIPPEPRDAAREFCDRQ
jgi:hypothetical protein